MNRAHVGFTHQQPPLGIHVDQLIEELERDDFDNVDREELKEQLLDGIGEGCGWRRPRFARDD